jgi:hypothetical protein
MFDIRGEKLFIWSMFSFPRTKIERSKLPETFIIHLYPFGQKYAVISQHAEWLRTSP